MLDQKRISPSYVPIRQQFNRTFTSSDIEGATRGLVSRLVVTLAFHGALKLLQIVALR